MTKVSARYRVYLHTYPNGHHVKSADFAARPLPDEIEKIMGPPPGAGRYEYMIVRLYKGEELLLGGYMVTV